MVAVLTGDIVKSSKMPDNELKELMNQIDSMLNRFKKVYHGLRYELFRGDSFQVVLFQPEHSIKLATLIRALVVQSSVDIRHMYDVRISIGLGDINPLNDKVTTSNGQAFTYSGHQLDKMKVRERLVFKSPNKTLNEDMTISSSMISVIISQWTLKRANIIFYMLCNVSREDICSQFHVSNSGLSAFLTASNYYELLNALQWSEERIKMFVSQIYK